MSDLTPETQAAVEEAVKQTLLKLGMDVSQPEHVVELQQDFQHLRKWRKSVNAVERQSFLGAMAVLGTGLVAALWLGIKQLITGHE